MLSSTTSPLVQLGFKSDAFKLVRIPTTNWAFCGLKYVLSRESRNLAISSMLILTSVQLVADGYRVVVASRFLLAATKTERSSASRSLETPSAACIVF